MDEKLKEILMEIKNHNNSLIQIFKKRYELIEKGENFDMESYVSSIEAFLSIISVVTSISDNIDIHVDVSNVQEKLEEFVTAIENNDKIVINDSIENKILPILDDLQNKLDNKTK